MQTNRQIYSWALYDWANSAYVTTVMAGFFPLFFKNYFSSGTDVITSTAQLGLANSFSSMIIVLMAPLLGAIADVGGLKKRFLLLFTYLGVLMSGSLALVQQGEWELAAFVYILGNIGFMGSNIFTDSLLPTVAKESEFDFVSGLGFALILFTFNVIMVHTPDTFGLAGINEAVKVSFVSVALWWALFSLPMLLFVKEERSLQKKSTVETVAAGYRQLLGTFRHLQKDPPPQGAAALSGRLLALYRRGGHRHTDVHRLRHCHRLRPRVARTRPSARAIHRFSRHPPFYKTGPQI